MRRKDFFRFPFGSKITDGEYTVLSRVNAPRWWSLFYSDGKEAGGWAEIGSGDLPMKLRRTKEIWEWF